eukprot:250109-Amphidinium_carterae.1
MIYLCKLSIEDFKFCLELQGIAPDAASRDGSGVGSKSLLARVFVETRISGKVPLPRECATTVMTLTRVL